MPIDPCTEGCLNHMIGAGEGPGAGDDPCNSNNNGYFCEGSYWTYDPTVGGADTGTWGDCPRAWIRTGGDCNVDQWLEISVANVITDTAPPVDGVDCCPPGTLWCVPVGSDGSTINQVWIQTGCTGDNCRWCQICGFPQAKMSEISGGQVLVEGAGFILLDFDTQDVDELNELVVGLPHGTYTAKNPGTYTLNGLLNVRLAQPNAVEGHLLRLVYAVNGTPTDTISQDGSGRIDATLGFRDISIWGSTTLKLNAGDVLTFYAAWDSDPNFNVTVTLAGIRINQVA